MRFTSMPLDGGADGPSTSDAPAAFAAHFQLRRSDEPLIDAMRGRGHPDDVERLAALHRGRPVVRVDRGWGQTCTFGFRFRGTRRRDEESRR